MTDASGRQLTFIGEADRHPDRVVMRNDLMHHFVLIPYDLTGLGEQPKMSSVTAFRERVAQVLMGVSGVELCRHQTSGDGPGCEIGAFYIYASLRLGAREHQELLRRVIGRLSAQNWFRGDVAAVIARALPLSG